jgi:hypothetical protein
MVGGRIAAAVPPADSLSALLVRRLHLVPFVFDDALLRARAILTPRHTGLAAVLAAHVLTALQIIRLRRCLSPPYNFKGNALGLSLFLRRNGPLTSESRGARSYRVRYGS